MNIEMPADLLERIMDTLTEATKELALCREREKQLRIEADRGKLLNEKQIQDYLQRDEDTLRYYRTLGLGSIKIGASRWYVKGIVDDWLAEGVVNRHKQ